MQETEAQIKTGMFSKSLNQRAAEVFAGFTKAVEEMENINIEANTEINNRAKEIEKLKNENQVLTSIMEKNVRVTDRLTKIFELDEPSINLTKENETDDRQDKEGD